MDTHICHIKYSYLFLDFLIEDKHLKLLYLEYYTWYLFKILFKNKYQLLKRAGLRVFVLKCTLAAEDQNSAEPERIVGQSGMY